MRQSYELHEGAQPSGKHLLHPLQGQACPEGDRGQGGGDEVPRSRRAVRENHERQRFRHAPPPHDGRDYRDGNGGGHRGEVPRPLAGRDDGTEGHPTEPGGDAHRRRPALPAHPIGHGRPAGQGGDGQPLRAVID